MNLEELGIDFEVQLEVNGRSYSFVLRHDDWEAARHQHREVGYSALSPKELTRLRAANGERLDAEHTEALLLVKSILGGRIVDRDT